MCLDAWHIDCGTQWSNRESQRQNGISKRNVYKVQHLQARWTSDVSVQYTCSGCEGEFQKLKKRAELYVGSEK